MSSNLEKLKVDSIRWREDLEKKLNNHQTGDAVVAYSQVALAFPSDRVNERSFEDPLIDHEELARWAAVQGWKVKAALELMPEGSTEYPHVRFIKER